MQIPFERRMLYIPILHIDTNLINARQKLADVNRLEQWAADEVILINMSGVAHAEAQADGNPQRAKKAATHLFTIDTEHEGDGLDDDAGAGQADELFTKIEAVLFDGGARDDNQRNDVLIVCDAIKWHAILVTNDGGSKSQPGGILGNRERLRAIADLQVMAPAEAVLFVTQKIGERDAWNKRVAAETGKPLPEWTEKD